MTIPEDPQSPSPSAGPEDPADPRVRRPVPERTGPNRNPQASGSAPRPARDPEPDPGPSISESISEAVKSGYDVLTETIEQGRAAAKRFRQGRYNVNDVPGDLQTSALRVVQLARELSDTTFDVCERLLKELGAASLVPDPAAGIPAFRGAPPKPPSPPPPTSDAGTMKLTVRLAGASKASSPTTFLARPLQPTSAADIVAEPLSCRSTGPDPITAVSFTSNLAIAGLIVDVTVPDGQAPGVYSGLVFAKGQEAPLGVLTVAVAP